ncbi:KIF22 protein, partial [Polypterus senegalus]
MHKAKYSVDEVLHIISELDFDLSDSDFDTSDLELEIVNESGVLASADCGAEHVCVADPPTKMTIKKLTKEPGGPVRTPLKLKVVSVAKTIDYTNQVMKARRFSAIGESPKAQQAKNLKREERPQNQETLASPPQVKENVSPLPQEPKQEEKVTSDPKEQEALSELLNILQHGSKKQLRSLNLIGDKKTKMIIEWRSHNALKQIEDLEKIDGISTKIVEALKTSYYIYNNPMHQTSGILYARLTLWLSVAGVLQILFPELSRCPLAVATYPNRFQLQSPKPMAPMQPWWYGGLVGELPSHVQRYKWPFSYSRLLLQVSWYGKIPDHPSQQ